MHIYTYNGISEQWNYCSRIIIYAERAASMGFPVSACGIQWTELHSLRTPLGAKRLKTGKIYCSYLMRLRSPCRVEFSQLSSKSTESNRFIHFTSLHCTALH